MGIKEEIREAKALAEQMKQAGAELAAISLRLNGLFDGFYFSRDGRLYRENVPVAAYPLTAIL